MFRIAICDDVERERTELAASLQRYAKRCGTDLQISEYARGEDLYYDYGDNAARYDLVVLDIFMDEMSGMETARKIRRYDRNVAIVFLTTSADFAVESYDVEAVGYLLKPLDDEKLHTLLKKLSKKEPRPMLEVKIGGTQHFLYIHEIVYLESRNHKVLFQMAGGEKLAVYGKLDDFPAQLDETKFLRCHKSFLVNMEFIVSAGECFVLENGHEIPIRAHGKKEVEDRYYRFFIERHLSRGERT